MMRRKAKRMISVENMVFDISTYYYILTNSVFFLGTSICEDGSSIFFVSLQGLYIVKCFVCKYLAGRVKVK